MRLRPTKRTRSFFECPICRDQLLSDVVIAEATCGNKQVHSQTQIVMMPVSLTRSETVAS